MEFVPAHEFSSAPEWITISPTSIDPNDYNNPGALSIGDLTCVELGRQCSDSTLVTNDKKLIETADRYGIDTEWGTALVMRSYRRCGISEAVFREGLKAYVDDVYLPDDVAGKLRETEKTNET